MSDFSFMRSGFDLIENNSTNNPELLKRTSSIVLSFTEYAMKNADIYVEHSKRNCITPEDVKRCLMNETFIYLDRQDNFTNIQKWEEIIKQEEQNQEDEDDESVDDEEEEGDDEAMDEDDNKLEKDDDFSLSKCECKLCKNINEIVQKWNNWKPNNSLECILKSAIDKI